MGDPKLLRRKFLRPTHPWQKARIEEERTLMREYGFKNKKELWKLNSKLGAFKSQVKDLAARTDDSALEQKQILLKKLQNLGLIDEKAILEDILALTLKDLCERRLQTIVLKKKMASSIKQARQLIVHEHINVGARKITSPSYIVSTEEEQLVNFADDSPLKSEDHPERIPLSKEVSEEMKKVGLKKDSEEEPKSEIKKEEKEESGEESKEEPEKKEEVDEENKKEEKKKE